MKHVRASFMCNTGISFTVCKYKVGQLTYFAIIADYLPFWYNFSGRWKIIALRAALTNVPKSKKWEKISIIVAIFVLISSTAENDKGGSTQNSKYKKHQSQRFHGFKIDTDSQTKFLLKIFFLNLRFLGFNGVFVIIRLHPSTEPPSLCFTHRQFRVFWITISVCDNMPNLPLISFITHFFVR